MVGRSADADGFLVEAPQKDGSRWIGRIGWESGEVTWLARGPEIAAFGVLGPTGDLAFCRRTRPDVGDAAASAGFGLVVRRHGTEPKELVLEAGTGESYLFPVYGLDPAYLAVLSSRSPASRSPP
jgi:hypothetical protein